MLHNIKLIDLPCWTDDTGSLVAIEADETIPFSMERLYYIFGTNADSHRGFHSHRRLYQLLICTHGSVDILVDDGLERDEISLDNPTKGLIIGPMVWREMLNFKNEAVLTVLASKHYDTSDYILDYDAFREESVQYFRQIGRESEI